jgi:hypothetical protein
LFPGLRMVVTNTFNHTSDKPRFRALFPTSEIMTPEIYGLIQGCLADKLEDAGYSIARGGKRKKGTGLSTPDLPAWIGQRAFQQVCSTCPAKRRSPGTASSTIIAGTTPNFCNRQSGFVT